MTIKRTPHLVFFIIIVTLLFSLIACGNAKETPKETKKKNTGEILKDKIIGKWTVYRYINQGVEKDSNRIDPNYNKIYYLELFSDNTYENNTGIIGRTGKWIILDDGRIKLTDALAQIYLGKTQGDSLVFKIHGDTFELYFKKAYEKSQYATAIIGTWQWQSDNKKMKREITFKKDGEMNDKFWFPGLPDPMVKKYQYKFIDENRIQYTAPEVYKINSLTSDQLVFQPEGAKGKGTQQIYKRISQ